MATFDVAVLGAGPGGYVAAIRAAQLGLKVALVEKEAALGGTCLRVGCIPSKALLESSGLYAKARNGLGDHGLVFEQVSLDLAALMRRKDTVVEQLTGGVAGLMKKNKVTVVHGVGRFDGPKRIVVEGEGDAATVEADHIIVATGSEPVDLPGLPFDGTRIVSSTEALAFEAVPEKLVVVGAGAVGLELGAVWSRLGAQVTVVELLGRIVPFADKMVASVLQRALKAQGLDFRLNTKVTGAEVTDTGVRATLENEKGEQEVIDCNRILVAVGRRPCLEGVGLDAVGVTLDEKGRIGVNEKLETSAAGVYAIGDLVAGPMLAHKAEDEGIAVAERIAGLPGHVNYDVIPSVVYTEPELAQVGITEEEAKEQGIACKVGRFYFRANGRALASGETEGLVKMIAAEKSDRLLGVHIVGNHASELIAEAVVAMEFGASSEDLARIVHAHPTLSEVVRESALAVDNRAIHA
ncbi:MAG: dihydrolipoyl dehydrogenase [bacterium]|nr:dihydrolipoyl dehydrogenase [bacterium]